MKRALLSALLPLFFLSKTMAQVPPACSPPVATPGETCAETCVTCSGLNNYMGTTAERQPSSIPNFCGSNENDQFFGFVAGATTATFTVTPSNCTNGDGVQIALYDDCEGVPLACNGGCSSCGGVPQAITVSNMVVGKNYWVLVDGWAGDICDFTLTMNPASAVIAPPVSWPSGAAVTGPAAVCTNDPREFCVPVASGAGFYQWTIPSDASINGISGPGPIALAAPDGHCATVLFGNSTGSKTVCAKAVNSCNSAAQLCKTVTTYAPSTATISGSTTTCVPSPIQVSIPVHFTGIGPWSITYNIDGSGGYTVNNITANPYTLTVIADGEVALTGVVGTGGCAGTASGSFLIVHSVVGFTGAATGATCFGLANGSVSVVPYSGAAPFNFSWSPPQGNTDNPTNLAAGTYTVTVTDAVGCTNSASYVVAQPMALAVNFINVVQPGCSTPNGGSVTAAPSGGTPGFTYHWSTGATTATISGLAVGSYSVTVTDAYTCTKAETFVLTANNSQPLAMAAAAQLTCAAATATVSGSGSSTGPSIAYLWTTAGGQISGPANELNCLAAAPGTYQILVTNTASGCTATASAVVSQNNAAPGATASGGTITCLLPADTLFGSSPTPGATFEWTGPGGFFSTNQNPVAAAPGDYFLKVTNPANGCTSTATAALLANNAPPTATASGGTLTCSVGTVNLTGSSSESGSAFLWAGPGGFSSTLQNPPVSVAGLYHLVVTSVSSGCTGAADAVVSQNTAAPTASATVPGNLNCVNSSVTIDGSASSQGPDFSHNWTTADGHIVSGGNTPTPVVDQPGLYLLSILNTSNGCTASTAVTVAQSTTVAAGISSIENAACFGGSNGAATAAATGGSGSFTYLWSNGATTATASGLPAGTYQVTATDGEGCTGTASATVGEPPVLLANATATPVSAPGSADGTAAASPSGGTPVFSYQWSNGATTAAISGLAPGSYSVVVTDANGCTATQTVVVNDAGCALSALINATNVTCFGAADGTATAQAAGASGGLSFLWSNGATTAAISGLAAGAYSCTVSDAGGCQSVGSTAIGQPPVLSLTATATACTAPGSTDGTATATASGGTPVFSYQWSNGATTAAISGLEPGSYAVTATDANGCTAVQGAVVLPFGCALSAAVSSTNVSCFGAADGTATATATGGSGPTFLWSNGATTAAISGLAPGAYSCTISDANGCLSVGSAMISEPTALNLTATSTACTAPGSTDGTATATVGGGTPGFTFLWSNGLATAAISGLAPGSYAVTATDANGCTAAQSATVAPFGCAVAAAVLTANISCFGAADGAAEASSTGGTAPFQYLWSNGATTSSIQNLGPGGGSVTVTDAAGCPGVAFFEILEPAVLQSAVAVISNNTCPEGMDGAATATATGGKPPHSFQWSNGQSGPTASGLPTGPVSLTVTDANGCTSTGGATIFSKDTEPPVLTCPAGFAVCGGESVSFAEPVATDNCSLGAAKPLLTGGLPSGAAFPLGTTVEVFQVTDASGNAATCSFTVMVEEWPTAAVDSVKNDVGGQGVGSIDITIGAGAASVAWTKNGLPFSNQTDLTGLFMGSYACTVTGANGCTTTVGPIDVLNTVTTGGLFEEDFVRLVPNPAADEFRVETGGWQPVFLKIFDARGLKVVDLPEFSVGPVGIERLPDGVYFVEIGGRLGGVEVSRLMKLK